MFDEQWAKCGLQDEGGVEDSSEYTQKEDFGGGDEESPTNAGN